MDPLNPFVLDLAVKGTLLLLVAFGGALLLRRASAAARHLHWQLALGGLLALPLLAAVTPRLAVPAGPLGALLAPARAEVAPAPGRPQAAHRETHPLRLALQAQAEEADRDARVERATEIDRPAEPAASSPAAAAPARRAGEREAAPRRPAFALLLALTPLQQVLLAWGAGTLALLALLAIGLLRAAALARGATPVTHPEWVALVDRVRRELGLRRVVALRRVPRCVVPMTFGWRRPVVLLPADADRWCASRRRHVLLHELAHVRRSDWLGQLAAQAACALWWWQPLAWIAARELRRQRELACDDQVLAFGSRASEYADHLLAIAASRGSGLATGVATLAMARRSQLEGRLLAVLQDGRPRRGPTPRRALAAATGAAALVVALACVQPEAEPAETQSASTDEAGRFEPRERRQQVEGAIVDAEGQPVPGATIQLRRAAPGQPLEISVPRVAPQPRPPVPLAPDPPEAPEPVSAPIELQFGQVRVIRSAPPPCDPFDTAFEGLEVSGLRGLGYVGDFAFDFSGDENTTIWSWSEDGDSWTVVSGCWVEPDETGTRLVAMDEDSTFVIEHEHDGHAERVEAFADDEGVQWKGTSGGQELDAEAAHEAADRMLRVALAHTSLFASERVAHLVETGGPAGALAALREMPANGSRTDLLCVLLTEHELEPADFGAALQLAAEGGGSESALADVLACIGPDALGDPDLVEPVFRAVESIESDAHQAETLSCLLDGEYADAPVLSRALVAATAGVDSDAYMAQVLDQVPSARLRDEAVRASFVAALATVESDAYAAEALERLSDARGIRGEALAELVAAGAQGIDSDAYMADVLHSLPERALTDGAARDALLAALATIESDAYMADVAASWLASDVASPDFAAALIAAAAQHVDSDPYLAQVLTSPESLRGDEQVMAAVKAALPSLQSRSYAAEVQEWLSEEE